mgnify:CR=1 FL=1
MKAQGGTSVVFIGSKNAVAAASGASAYASAKAAAEALTAAGLGPAYRILAGFEGGFDAAGHRSVSGWKNVGLPWRQG